MTELMLHPLTVEEVPALYKRCLRRDFPRGERRPLAMITGPMKAGAYRGYTALAGGEEIGYAFLGGREGGDLLLDYLAVEPQRRSEGWGGKFLAALRKTAPTGQILIEAEDPSMTDAPDEAALRRRRVAFYRRCGAAEVGVRWQLFGVDYTILCLPPAGEAPLSPQAAALAMPALYREMGVPAALLAGKAEVWADGAEQPSR